MRRSLWTLLVLVAAVPVLLVATALLYEAGMAHLEGKPRTFWDSLSFVSETLSSTGYGADARWSHPGMVVFVIVLQFVGAFVMTLIIPVILLPFLEARFEQKIPRRAPGRLRDHLVVFRYGAAVETLVEQLAAAEKRFLIVETDEGVARRLLERNLPVVYTRDDEDAMEVSHLASASGVVTNGPDEENVAAILRARQLGFAGPIFSLAEDPIRRRPMELAGATGVYTPKHMLAAALAARASDLISPRLSGIQQIGELELREVRVELGSVLAGKTLHEIGDRPAVGATVIGQWVGGRLVTQPGPDARLEPHSVLVVIGSHDALERLSSLAEGAVMSGHEGPIVIAGQGEVGGKVRQLLTDSGEKVFTIDRGAHDGVDLVGNVLDPGVLRRSAVKQARSVVLALDSDDATLFATVILRDIAPEVPIVARVNKARNVENIHRAGADFALSVSQVSGQMLSYRLLGQESFSVDQQLKVLKVSARGFDGRHPSRVAIDRRQCSIVAVERGREVIVDFRPEFRLRRDDTVFICGSEAGVRAFLEQYPQT